MDFSDLKFSLNLGMCASNILYNEFKDLIDEYVLKLFD